MFPDTSTPAIVAIPAVPSSNVVVKSLVRPVIVRLLAASTVSVPTLLPVTVSIVIFPLLDVMVVKPATDTASWKSMSLSTVTVTRFVIATSPSTSSESRANVLPTSPSNAMFPALSVS